MKAIEQLRKLLEDSKNIVFFGGAGVSTESGIPDFRSESGLYQAQRQYGRSPEELLSHHLFAEQPALFYSYYKDNLIHADAAPNNAHRALAELERRGTLRAVVTQNIDGLHQTAGSTCVWELHGSVLRNYCVDCEKQYTLDYIMAPPHCVDGGGKAGPVPYCEVCGGIVRPDVVLYEESLDSAVVEAAVSAIRQADTLIVGGTSLAVYPAAGLLQYFRGKHLILINKSETPYDSKAGLVIRDPIGKVLGEAVGSGM